MEVGKNPQNPDAHFFLGALYEIEREYLKAKNSSQEALYLEKIIMLLLKQCQCLCKQRNKKT